MTSYSLIGLMSGTSMDGVDLAQCTFGKMGEDWNFTLLNCHTFAYPDAVLEKLKRSKRMTGLELTDLDHALGTFFAQCILEFSREKDIDLRTIDAVASHGHTVFHQPEKGFTLQIGCGVTMSALLGVPVINDFRKKDVLAGGQGAPLVPIGDCLLFRKEASAFLNVGGFANICLLEPHISAFDICPGNLPLNILAEKVGKSYDQDGAIARAGKVDVGLLKKLNALPYYAQSGPKSLGTEWLEQAFMPILDNELSLENRMRTCVEHIAGQIVACLPQRARVFITGGGARNSFLIERIQALHSGEIRIPAPEIIDYKEALIFAFLGALYLHGDNNCLAAVTGAKKDVRGGVMHSP